MMRSLWTAASGMISQQTNVDTISNNLANINTTGYKKESAQFKTLFYQTLQEKSTNADGTEKPVGVQTGLGVRNSAIVSQFTQGPMQQTGNDFDFAIQGNGFFRVQTADGSTAFTRNGSFGLSMGANGLVLATSEGYPVLDTKGAPIVFDSNINAQSIKIDESGNIEYPDVNGNIQSVQISIAQFNNPAGLEKAADSILNNTTASGAPRLESEDANLKKCVIKKGFLEGSNVQTVNEMVDLIVAQRAYEMNSKSITAADEMLQQANNLRR